MWVLSTFPPEWILRHATTSIFTRHLLATTTTTMVSNTQTLCQAPRLSFPTLRSLAVDGAASLVTVRVPDHGIAADPNISELDIGAALCHVRCFLLSVHLQICGNSDCQRSTWKHWALTSQAAGYPNVVTSSHLLLSCCILHRLPLSSLLVQQKVL
jgi:hypothetical protein